MLPIGSHILRPVSYTHLDVYKRQILRCGGEVRFGTRVESLVLDGNRVTGVVTARDERVDGPVILATGHSARDVYRFLDRAGIAIEPKGIAVGVRVEHPQQLIDSIQYHNPVSYTHLDVYKRQGLNCTMAN